METANTAEQNEMNELEALNDLSEETIRDEYLGAALHGPRWILGLIDEAV